MRYPYLLMSTAALVLGLLGLASSFAPDLVLGWVGAEPAPALLLMVQILGALYLGFAILNWMARGNALGGIYGRPLVLGNMLHFISGGLAASKAIVQEEALRELWPLVLVYAAFALAFSSLLFRHPGPKPSQ